MSETEIEELVKLDPIETELDEAPSDSLKRTPSQVLKSEEFRESGIHVFIISIVIPMMTAFGLVVQNFLKLNSWDYTVFLVTLTTVSIPAVRSWLKNQFSRERMYYRDHISTMSIDHEKELNEIKDKHRTKMKNKDDEIQTLKIKGGLMEYQINHPERSAPL